MTTDTVTATPALSTTASALRRLYFVRFGFAILWALVMFTTAKHIGPLAATLLMIYPAVRRGRSPHRPACIAR